MSSAAYSSVQVIILPHPYLYYVLNGCKTRYKKFGMVVLKVPGSRGSPNSVNECSDITSKYATTGPFHVFKYSPFFTFKSTITSSVDET
jgi:hypothetical protein